MNTDLEIKNVDFDMIEEYEQLMSQDNISDNFLSNICNNYFDTDPISSVDEISNENRMILIDKLIDDSEFLLGLSDNRKDITENMVIEILTINNIDINLILRLYNNQYNFSIDQSTNLIKSLHFLLCEKLEEIILYIKLFNRNIFNEEIFNEDIKNVFKKMDVGEYSEDWKNIIKHGKLDLYLYLINIGKISYQSTKNTCLSLACKHGQMKIFQYLLDNRINVNSQHNKSLKNACEYGHYEMVKILLPKYRRQKSDTIQACILLSLKNGHNEITKLLLDYKKNVTLSDSDGIPQYEYVKLLRFSGENGNVEMTHFYIDKIETMYLHKETLFLEEICKRGHLEILKIFVNMFFEEISDKKITTEKISEILNNISIKSIETSHDHITIYLMEKRNEFGRNNLFMLKHAISYNNLNIVQYLLDKEKFSKKSLSDGLEYACSHGYAKMAKIIMNFDVKIDINNSYKNYIYYNNSIFGGEYYVHSAHMVRKACYDGNCEMMQIFIDMGFDISQYGKDCLKTACSGEHVSLIELLIENGLNISEYKDILLKIGCEFGFLQIVKLAIKYDANIHLDDNYALKITSEYNFPEIVEFLLEKGANVHAENEISLQRAICKGNYKVVKYLIDYGANINFGNGLPLTIACQNGHLNIVNLLIDSGVNIHLDNEKAFRYAVYFNHLEIARFLISKNVDLDVNSGESLVSASQNGNMGMVSLLISSGIQLGKKQALEVAIAKNKSEVVEYLKSLGIETSRQSKIKKL